MRTEPVKNYRIKLHDLTNGTQIAIPSYRIVSYWEVDKTDKDPGHTLINVEGIDDPVLVSESFEFVDKIVLRAFGWKIPYKKETTVSLTTNPAIVTTGPLGPGPIPEMQVSVSE